MYLQKISNDLFDICSRLLSVNDGYRVYYNGKTGKFEVHDINQHDGTLAFVVPYDRLDARTVFYAQKTARQNADKIFAEIDANNADVDRQKVKKYAEKCLQVLEGDGLNETV